MSPEDQRIQIAAACGWRWQEGTEPTYGGTNIPRGWINPKTNRCVVELPDYLKDLNAMHDAEKSLPALPYLYKLQDIVLSEEERLTSGGYTKLIRATAAQRAEAFLKSIGKWA